MPSYTFSPFVFGTKPHLSLSKNTKQNKKAMYFYLTQEI